MKVSYSWLKEYMGERIPEVSTLEELLTFHSFEIDGVETVGEDIVLDVKILPNRSSDCLCHRGVAREISALANVPLGADPLIAHPSLFAHASLKVTVADPSACRYFNIGSVRGISVKSSPEWLQERLRAIGQRPINNIVDATNYVMFAIGQPLHAYDAEKLSRTEDGAYHIGTRMARNNETVVILGGETHTLSSLVQIIVDMESDTPIGIAGVKGGAEAVISDNTTHILIEAGNFEPTLTRRTAQALRLPTDAAKRFENNLSPSVAPTGLSMVLALIVSIAGGETEGVAHTMAPGNSNPPVSLETARVEKMLGMKVSVAEIRSVFNRLGFQYTEHDDYFEVIAPAERTDILIEEDLIEEIGRIVGYESINAIVPPVESVTAINARHYYAEIIRAQLLSLGFSEIISSSFRKKDIVQLQNALASDKSYLRSALYESITVALDKNIHFTDLLGVSDVRLFEIGTVFSKKKGYVSEHVSCAFGVRLRSVGYSGKEDVFVKEALQLIEDALGISLTYTMDQGVVEFSLTDCSTQLSLPTSYAPMPVSPEVWYIPFSPYPAISRDIAVWVSTSVSKDHLESICKTQAGPLCVRVALFDTFTKAEQTSYAFRLVFQSTERTLTDEEVNQIMQNISTEMVDQGFAVR